MERNVTNIRLEIDISAQKILQQIKINNNTIEDQLQKGIKKGLDEFFNEEIFIETVKIKTKESIEKVIFDSVNNWAFQQKVRNILSEKIEKKINIHAEKIAEKIFKEIT